MLLSFTNVANTPCSIVVSQSSTFALASAVANSSLLALALVKIDSLSICREEGPAAARGVLGAVGVDTGVDTGTGTGVDTDNGAGGKCGDRCRCTCLQPRQIRRLRIHIKRERKNVRQSRCG